MGKNNKSTRPICPSDEADTSYYLQHFRRPFLCHAIETYRTWVAFGLIEKNDSHVEHVDRWQRCPDCGYEIALVKIGDWPAVWLNVIPLFEGFQYRAVDLASNPHHCEVW